MTESSPLDLEAIEWRLRDRRMMYYGPFSVQGFIDDETALIREVKRLRAQLIGVDEDGAVCGCARCQSELAPLLPSGASPSVTPNETGE